MVTCPAIIPRTTLAITVGMPLYGRLSDLVGRKNLYLIAIGLFLLGSALCGTAGTMVTLVFYRFIQGVGGGGLMVLSQAITGDLIPPRVRAAYMAPMIAASGLLAFLPKDIPLSHHTGLQMRAASETQDAAIQGVPASGEEIRRKVLLTA